VSGPHRTTSMWPAPTVRAWPWSPPRSRSIDPGADEPRHRARHTPLTHWGRRRDAARRPTGCARGARRLNAPQEPDRPAVPVWAWVTIGVLTLAVAALITALVLVVSAGGPENGPTRLEQTG